MLTARSEASSTLRVQHLSILPDDNDRHVLAVAIESNADAIVAWILEDFPEPTTKPFGVAVLDPDEFVCTLIEHSEDAVIAAMKEHRQSLKNPPSPPQNYFENLQSRRLFKVARSYFIELEIPDTSPTLCPIYLL